MLLFFLIIIIFVYSTDCKSRKFQNHQDSNTKQSQYSDTLPFMSKIYIVKEKNSTTIQ